MYPPRPRSTRCARTIRAVQPGPPGTTTGQSSHVGSAGPPATSPGSSPRGRAAPRARARARRAAPRRARPKPRGRAGRGASRAPNPLRARAARTTRAPSSARFLFERTFRATSAHAKAAALRPRTLSPDRCHVGRWVPHSACGASTTTTVGISLSSVKRVASAPRRVASPRAAHPGRASRRPRAAADAGAGLAATLDGLPEAAAPALDPERVARDRGERSRDEHIDPSELPMRAVPALARPPRPRRGVVALEATQGREAPGDAPLRLGRRRAFERAAETRDGITVWMRASPDPACAVKEVLARRVRRERPDGLRERRRRRSPVRRVRPVRQALRRHPHVRPHGRRVGGQRRQAPRGEPQGLRHPRLLRRPRRIPRIPRRDERLLLRPSLELDDRRRARPEPQARDDPPAAEPRELGADGRRPRRVRGEVPPSHRPRRGVARMARRRRQQTSVPDVLRAFGEARGGRDVRTRGRGGGGGEGGGEGGGVFDAFAGFGRRTATFRDETMDRLPARDSAGTARRSRRPSGRSRRTRSPPGRGEGGA